MEEKKNQTTWEDAGRFVSELIADTRAQAKRWFVAFVITLTALVGTNIYWIYQWNSYDYVSQDGEGYNYYNSDIEGDVDNGAENTPKEEQTEK